MPKRKFVLRTVFFFLCALLCFFSSTAHAKKEKKKQATLNAPVGTQPYPHQWFETKTKKGATVFGQAYRPRNDLLVLEMIPQSSRGEPIQIKSVRIKTASGKVYEGRIRRLPFGFMPTARQNYMQPDTAVPFQEVQTPRESSQ